MLILGLTGSIATGKSTVAALLTSPPHNLPLIDADLLARQVVAPGRPAYRKIVRYFSASTPDLLLPPSSSTDDEAGATSDERPLNRAALGRRVFGSTPPIIRDRLALNRIVHPAVRWEIWKGLLLNYLHGYWCTVIDVPLLFESGMDRFCGVVMVVAVTNAEVQMGRLRARDPHLSAEDARARVESQVGVGEKVKRVEARGDGMGVVVWNDKESDELQREVRKGMDEVRVGSPAWWAMLLWLLPPLGMFIAFETMLRSALARKTWLLEKQREKARL